MSSTLIVIGILLIIIGFISSIIIYALKKKIHPIGFLIGIEVYFFSVFYIWDGFELKKNQIMLLLILSTVFLGLIGHLLTGKVLKQNNNKKQKYGICVLSVLIILLFAVNSFSNLDVQYSFFDKLEYTENSEIYTFGNVTIKNPSIFPKVYEPKKIQICVNNRAVYPYLFHGKNNFELSRKEQRTINLSAKIYFKIQEEDQITINEFTKRSSSCENSKILKKIKY